MISSPQLVVGLALLATAALLPARAQERTQGPDAAAAGREGEKLRLVSGDEMEAEAWRLKAEELRRQGDDKGARVAFEEAIRRHLKLYVRETSPERAPGVDAKPEVRARFRQAIAARLKVAAESIDGYFALKGTDAGLGRDQLEAIRAYAQLLNEQEASRTVFWGSEVERKARILSKPEPGFTEEARHNRVSGMVRLRMVLSSDRRVRHIFVLKGLPHGIAEEAIDAAGRMRFEPAVKDGQPVSQFVTIEYNFYTY